MWKRILGIAVVGVIFLFLGKAVVQNWEIVAAYEWKVRYTFVMLSFVILCLVFFCTASVWWLTVCLFAKKIEWKSGISLFAKAQLVKYLPGKIGQPLAFAYLLSREGIPKRRSFFVAVVFPAFVLVAALTVASVFLGISSVPTGRRYVWVIALLALVALHPRVLQRVFSVTRREVEVDYSYGQVLLIVLLMAVVQIMTGLALLAFVIAVYPTGIENLPLVVGSFALAFLIGFITPVSPAGLGVREGALVFALKGVIVPALLTLTVVGFRLLTIASDVFCVGMTRVFSRRPLV